MTNQITLPNVSTRIQVMTTSTIPMINPAVANFFHSRSFYFIPHLEITEKNIAKIPHTSPPVQLSPKPQHESTKPTIENTLTSY